jgi:hypothetical protein
MTWIVDVDSFDADVRLATLVILIRSPSPAINAFPVAVAMVPTAPQLCVERVKTSASSVDTSIDPMNGRTCPST